MIRARHASCITSKPVSFSYYCLYIYRYCTARRSDNDNIHRLFVAKCKVCLKPQAIKHGHNIELGRQVCVVIVSLCHLNGARFP